MSGTYRKPPSEYRQQPSAAIAAATVGMGKLAVSKDSQISGATTFVKRPGFGKAGNMLQILVNVFKIEIPESDIYRYDVVVKDDKSDRIPKEVCRRIFEEWKKMDHTEKLKWTQADQDNAKNIAYDGQKLLYCPKALKGIGAEPVTFDVDYIEPFNDKPRNLKVILKRITNVNIEVLHYYLSRDQGTVSVEIPNEAISAFEVLLRQIPCQKFTTNPAGRAFFSDASISALPNGIDGFYFLFFFYFLVHYGWYQSLRPGIDVNRSGMTYKKLLMNLDVAATCFYTPGPLIQVIAKFFGRRSIDECKDYFNKRDDLQRLRKYLMNVNIEITYRTTGRRKYKIGGLSKDSVAKSFLKLKKEDGTEMNTTHADYFRNAHGVNLKYTWLPAILYGKQLNGIPIELCNILPNQRYNTKISDTQAADMVKVTAVKPEARRQRIMEGMGKLHGNNDKDLLDAWGVKIDASNILGVSARILAPPKIVFSKNKELIPQGGQWRFGRGNNFSRPATLGAWSVAVFGGNKKSVPLDVIENFLGTLEQQLTGLGVKVNWPDTTEEMVVYETRGNIKRTLEEARDVAVGIGKVHKNPKVSSNTRQVDIVIVILQSREVRTYNIIKKIAETELSLMTQVCLLKHIKANKPDYCGNLILKINAKLGGSNSYVSPNDLPFLSESQPTIVFGMDVTHPPPGVANGVSIAALVGSMDRNFTIYRSAIRAQVGRKEIVNELETMFMDMFQKFKDRSKIFPARVLFYRDGVSEGQFGEVVYTEVNAMKSAFAKMGLADKMPKITFLSVNKRHHIRFFPMRPNDADRSGNVNAGTVVDTGVAHPYEFDFFLNSHAGLQGTSRPTHYHVLYDENKFTADTMQLLTYRMCYLYARASKAVSIVPAVYYAHLVAARARCHMSEGGSDSASISSGAVSEAILSQVEKDISNSMFFV